MSDNLGKWRGTAVTRTLVLGSEGRVRQVRVSVKLEQRLPSVTIVGVSASHVREVAERVRSAIEASGFEFPRCRVNVTLWDTQDAYVSTSADLAIAVAILVASEQIPEPPPLRHYVGELSLAGDLRPVRGMFAFADYVNVNYRDVPVLVAPYTDENLSPAAASLDSESAVFRVKNLRDALDGSLGSASEVLYAPWPKDLVNSTPDFSDLREPPHNEVRDQVPLARRLTQAVAHRHGVCFTKAMPGFGVTALSMRVPMLLRETDDKEQPMLNTCATMASIAGLPFSGRRPFRAPHHSVSLSGLLGTKSHIGELALAHNGVLLLDEVDSFSRHVLEGIASWMRVSHWFGAPRIQIIAKSELSREELDAKLPASFMALLPVNIELNGPVRGTWPSSDEMLAMVRAARGGA